MRILIVHNYYQHKGGEDVVFQQEVDALKKKHDIETLTFKNYKTWQGLLQFALYPWNILAANKIVAKAKDFKADIVHIHNTHYAIGPFVFRKLHRTGFKTIQTLHNYRLLEPSALLFAHGRMFLDSMDEVFPWKSVKNKTLDNSYIKTFWVAFTYYIHHKLGTWKQVDRFLVFSDFMKNLILQSRRQIKKEQLTIKVNAIEKIEHTKSEKTNSFVYIGRLSEEKGILTLICAFSQCPDYTIEIYGDGPLVNQVMEAAALHNNIIYKGFQSKQTLNQAISTCQALVVPSICFEGMPVNVIESYAMRVPVIASKIGALSEMVIHRKTGLHFEAGNPQSLVDAVKDFFSLSEEDKQAFSLNCLQQYYDKYQLSDNIESLENIYRDVLKGK